MLKKSPPLLRKLTSQEETALLEHGAWLASDGASGVRADFRGHDFAHADLKSRDLRGSNLADGKLTNADLSEASMGEALVPHGTQPTDFTRADLTSANLNGADFHGAILSDAEFHDAVLRGADLRGTQGTLPVRFSGADLNGAKLPEAFQEFETLKVVADAAEYSRNVFIAMLAACVYSWLTIATTTDLRLLANSASLPLPFVSAPIPIAGFYTAAPLILFSVYIYFHLNLQRLWELLVTLPAVLPDGRPLDQAADPWLTVGIVRSHLRNLRVQRRPLSRVQYFSSATLPWWLVPATLLWFWLRYLTRQDWWGTLFQVVLIAISIALGARLQKMARSTLRSSPRRSSAPLFTDAVSVLTGAVVFCGLFILSAGTIGILDHGPKIAAPSGEMNVTQRDPLSVRKFARIFGIRPVDEDLAEYLTGWATKNPRRYDAQAWVPRLFRLIGYQPYVDVQGQDVSSKPLSWFRDNKPLDLIGGIDLHHTRIRYLQAWSSFLARANLRSADLVGAQLSYAHLNDADLNGTCLAWSVLRGADLGNASLIDADMTGSALNFAHLEGAQLVRADLSHALLLSPVLKATNFTAANFKGALLILRLSQANVAGADFTDAVIGGSDLSGANLIEAVGLTAAQVKTGHNWEDAILPLDLLDELGQPWNHDETVLKQIERKVAAGADKPEWWDSRDKLRSAIAMLERPRATVRNRQRPKEQKPRGR